MPCLKKACPAGVQIHQRLLIFSVCHLPALVVHEISRRPPYPSTGTLSGLKREPFVCDATPPQPVSMAIRHIPSKLLPPRRLILHLSFARSVCRKASWYGANGGLEFAISNLVERAECDQVLKSYRV